LPVQYPNMVNWETSDLNQYEAKRKASSQSPQQRPDQSQQSREANIQREIESYCRSRGWIVVRSRMDQRTTVAVGTPDLIIARSGGTTLWIEVKRPGGKLSTEQRGTLAQLERLGQRCAVVCSLREFAQLEFPDQSPIGDPGKP